MAKKDPKDFTVEEKLKYLYQLQTTLSEIDDKKALRGELPLEVQDLEDEIEGLSTRVQKIQNEVDEFQKAVVQKKGDIEKAKASAERYAEAKDAGFTHLTQWCETPSDAGRLLAEAEAGADVREGLSLVGDNVSSSTERIDEWVSTNA